MNGANKNDLYKEIDLIGKQIGNNNKEINKKDRSKAVFSLGLKCPFNPEINIYLVDICTG